MVSAVYAAEVHRRHVSYYHSRPYGYQPPISPMRSRVTHPYPPYYNTVSPRGAFAPYARRVSPKNSPKEVEAANVLISLPSSTKSKDYSSDTGFRRPVPRANSSWVHSDIRISPLTSKRKVIDCIPLCQPTSPSREVNSKPLSSFNDKGCCLPSSQPWFHLH